MWGGAGETPPLKSKTTVLPRSLVQSRNLECRDHDSETTVSPSLKSSDAAEAEAEAEAEVEAEVEAEAEAEAEAEEEEVSAKFSGFCLIFF